MKFFKPEVQNSNNIYWIYQKMNNQNSKNIFQEKDQQLDRKILRMDNYFFIKNRDQLEYLAHTLFIQKFFNIKFQQIERNLEQNDQKIFKEIQDSKNQLTMQNSADFFQRKDSCQSYTKYTRKKNKMVFLQVKRKTQTINQKQLNKKNIQKFTFYSKDGRILHSWVCKQENAIQKVCRFIFKHFLKMQSIVIIDDQIQKIQQSINLIKQLLNIKFQTDTDYIYIYQGNGRQLIQKYKFLDFLGTNNKLNKINRMQKQVLDTKMSKQCRNYELQEKYHLFANTQIDKIINKVNQINQIKWFIDKFLVKSNCNRGQLCQLDKKEFDSIYALYFNLIFYLKCQYKIKSLNQTSQEKVYQSFKLINDQLKKLVQQALNQYQAYSDDQNKQQQNDALSFIFCHPPSTMQSIKICVYCKSRKSKFGCIKCQIKNKKQIHLCIGNCFKEFHLKLSKDLPDKDKYQRNERRKIILKLKPSKIYDESIEFKDIELQKKNIETDQNNKKQKSQYGIQFKDDDALIRNRFSNLKKKRKLIKKIIEDKKINIQVKKGVKFYKLDQFRYEMKEQQESEQINNLNETEQSGVEEQKMKMEEEFN